jgi:protein tyrosine phosphatase (PTP) superfamily phosphohydrolase (DUF442 family)
MSPFFFRAGYVVLSLAVWLVSGLCVCSTVHRIWERSIDGWRKIVKRESHKNRKMFGVSVNACLSVVVVFQSDARPKIPMTARIHPRASSCTRLIYQQLPKENSVHCGIMGEETMRFRFRSSLIYAALASSLAFFACLPSFAQKIEGVSDPAKQLSFPNLPNSAQITPTLYRGAQPDASGYSQLKNLGVEIVVDFRQEKSEIKDEQARVESSGMRFVSIPWSPLNDPTRAQIISFFALLKDNPQRKVFIHCEAGADRTGTMVALYRVGLDGWTPQQAIAEMRLFHFHNVLYGHLAQLVQKFPAAIAADPALLAGFAPKTANSQDH